MTSMSVMLSIEGDQAVMPSIEGDQAVMPSIEGNEVKPSTEEVKMVQVSPHLAGIPTELLDMISRGLDYYSLTRLTNVSRFMRESVSMRVSLDSLTIAVKPDRIVLTTGQGNSITAISYCKHRDGCVIKKEGFPSKQINGTSFALVLRSDMASMLKYQKTRIPEFMVEVHHRVFPKDFKRYMNLIVDELAGIGNAYAVEKLILKAPALAIAQCMVRIKSDAVTIKKRRDFRELDNDTLKIAEAPGFRRSKQFTMTEVVFNEPIMFLASFDKIDVVVDKAEFVELMYLRNVFIFSKSFEYCKIQMTRLPCADHNFPRCFILPYSNVSHHIPGNKRTWYFWNKLTNTVIFVEFSSETKIIEFTKTTPEKCPEDVHYVMIDPCQCGVCKNVDWIQQGNDFFEPKFDHYMNTGCINYPTVPSKRLLIFNLNLSYTNKN